MAKTSLQDRVIIHELAQAGYSDRQIAERVGWSLPTIRKWRRRAQCQGHKGLSSRRQGRPPTGALSTYPSGVREILRVWREAHPGWGPKTLCIELEDHEPYRGQSIPHRSRIARWLKQEGFTRSYERHHELPQSSSFPAQVPHEEWEMDARGYQHVPDVGVIALLNLMDVFSKVKVHSYPCWLGEKRASRHPTTEDYQLVLRLAFSEWGLPDRLAVDHDSVFYDNASKSPFPAHLHLWLLALGVPLTFGRMGQATDQATVERSHQTWYQQVLAGQCFPNWEALREALNSRRVFLNERLPCATLGEVPPLVAHPQARIPRRLYRPEWELELLDLSRVYTYLSQGQWVRKVSDVGTVSLGGQVYVVGRAWAKQKVREVEITFDPTDQHLVFHSPDGEKTKRLPIQGVTPHTLMGELGPLAHLDGFQLALPFSWNEWRVIQICETFRDTT